MRTATVVSFFLLVGFLGKISAQVFYQTEFDPIVLKTDYDFTKKEYLVTSTMRVFGNYSLAIEFHNVRNITPPSHFRTVMKSGGTILRLKPTREDQPAEFSMEFSYILGRCDARPDNTIVYRLPFSSLKKDAVADTIVNLNLSAFAKARPTNRKSFSFKLLQGDTIFTVRKGVVVTLGNRHTLLNVKENPALATTIRVEHADGTIAVYEGLEQGSVVVKPGDKVTPETPLGKAGSVGENKYALFFYVYYIEEAKMVKGNEYKANTAFTSTFVDPVFSTDKGDVKLVQNQPYTPKVTEELITAEMNKKELKKRSENK